MRQNEYKKEAEIGQLDEVNASVWLWQQRLRAFLDNVSHGRLMQYLPHALYVVLLGAIYIGNRHRVDRVIRRIDVVRMEVEGLRADYMHAKTNYMHAIKRSALIKRAKKIGLVESAKPPEIIYLDK